MARVVRYDRVQLDATKRRHRDSDGALIVEGRFARTGLQAYEQGDGETRIEWRPEPEVVASAASFDGVALTDQHPDGMVTPGSWRTLARGHLQNPRYVDGWLVGDFVVHDAEAALKIERGELRELSAGYYAESDETPGEFDGEPYHAVQRGIVGNHVALLPEGTARAGRDARLVLDSAGNQVRPDRSGSGNEDQMEEEETTVAAEEEEETLDSVKADRDKLSAELDAAKSKISELEAALKKATSTDSVSAIVTRRVALIDRARKLAGDSFDVTGTDSDVMRRALTSVGVDTAGRTDAYVEARFDIAVEAKPARYLVDAVRSVQHDGATDDAMQPLIDAIVAARRE